MPASKQTYIGGLDQDTSKSKFRNQSYYDAKNIRVITDDGLSTGAIENEKGNKLTFQIPDTAATYKLRRIDEDALANSEIIAFNGVQVSYDVSDNIITTDDLFIYLEAHPTVAALIANNTVSLLQDDVYVYIIGLDSPLAMSVNGADTVLEQTVAPQEGLKIIGWGRIRERIVVFTTAEDGKEPIGTAGQIWVLEYDEFSNTVIDINGTSLVPSKHLIYNNLAEFSTYHRIEEPVGRYETTNTARVYWTDFNNSLRVINIFNPDNFLIPPGDLDIVANADLALPKILSIGSGSIPSASMVQYGYRLLNSTSGNETIISPLTRVLPLTDQNPNTAEFNGNLTTSPATAYRGDTAVGAFTSRSVTWSVENIDQDYDVIEHFVVIWTTVDNPQIFKFGEDNVPSDGSIEVTYLGTEDTTQITAQEFNVLNNPFVAKSLSTKDDRLVAANIREKHFESDFDARAYRSKENQGDFTIFTKDGVGSVFNSGTWSNIPDTHDAINAFNQEDPDINSDWFANDQYKYQPGTTVLGGAGPNISYTFVDQETTGNFNNDTPSTLKHINVGRNIASDPDFSLGERTLDGDLITYPSVNQFTNFASPIVHSLFQGYARGEVYRFGLVLYDKKGNPSFVRWIADIKMPEAYEDAPFSRSFGADVGNRTVICKNLGVQFIVDVSSVQSEISGYSIVRTERAEKDKTRLGTGIQTMYHSEENNGTNAAHRNFIGGADGRLVNVVDGINGANNQTIIHLMDRPGFTPFHGIGGGPGNGNNKAVCNFHSPLGLFRGKNGYSFKARDYIKTLGYYQTRPFNGYKVTAGERSTLFYNKLATFLPIANANGTEAIVGAGTVKFPNGAQEHLIEDEQDFLPGQAFASGTGPTAGVGSFNSKDYVVNAWGARKNNPDKQKIMGLGARKHMLVLNTNLSTTAWWEGAGVMKYYGGLTHDQDQASNFIPGDQTGLEINYFKVISYNRFLRKQYGGNDYFSRSKSAYISTGHYQQVNDFTVSTNIAFNIFGGDVFVNYFDDEYIAPYLNTAAAEGEPYHAPVASKFGMALVYPCETTLNTELRANKHWASDRDFSGTAGGITTHSFDDLNLLAIYDQENNAKEQFFAKDALLNLTEEHSHEIRVSEAKIDGELIDSWRLFLPANRLPVEGAHGQINKIINHKGEIYYYQDSALGLVSIRERALVPSETGIELVLGRGDVIDDYRYLSTETGTVHQHSVVSSGNSLYHFDERQKKLFKISGEGVQPISDVKGLSSFFPKLDGRFEKNDLTLRRIEEGSVGVHGVFDSRHNRVLFTVLESRKYDPIAANTFYPAGSVILQDGIYYIANEDVPALAIPTHPSSDPKWDDQQDKFGNNTFVNNLTVSYNEYIQAFESFLDYTPRIYLNVGRRILSENPKADGDVYEHNEGEYGNFYGERFPSRITVLINPEADLTKVFDNLEYHSEVSIDDIDQDQDTLSTLRFYNEYQDTGTINLVVGSNVKRRMRRWRTVIPRDGKARLRNPYIFLDLTFSNSDNKRLVLHDIITHFRTANM